VHIDWVVTCRYAESDGAVATIVGAGIDVLHVPAIPAEVGVMVAVRLAVPFEAFEDGARQDVRCQVLGPDSQPVTGEDGAPVDPLSFTVAMPAGARQLVPGWLINPLVAFQVRWHAGSAGSYTLVTSTDEDERLSPVHVLLAV
jgi:hypothetical protein